MVEPLDLLAILRDKVIIGTPGPITRPFVVLYEDEFRAVLEALEAKPKRGRPPKVPHETIRA